MAQPTHVPASLRELALLADEIHHLAGDTSVDPTWYTKRGGLSVIYASSELFMTNDRSPGFGETRAFLQRRLAEAGSLSGTVSSVAQWAGFTASAGLNVLRSKGQMRGKSEHQTAEERSQDAAL
ncbi:COQ9-domain-containing protein [Xylariaceae sp. FL1651]|nr:COQ9-domain-containing protein [Xylariaceae sp. FL1651]